MEDNVGKYFLVDEIIKDSALADDIDMNRDNMVYEVIRIIDGVPLFFEDHYERMEESFKAIASSLDLKPKEFKKRISILIESNGNKNCNIKFIVFIAYRLQRVISYISKCYYPSAQEISNGVRVGLLQLERINPNVKFVNNEYKETVSRKIEEGGFLELLLVDHNGNITEGSASNVFFVKGEKIFTAPSEKIIKGITRKYVLEACKRANYEVIEANIPVSELENFEGVFLSGTSKNVLPVSEIDGKKYLSSKNPVIIAVEEEYCKLLKNYIKDNRGKI